MSDSALTPQEVADILKISKNTVYELIKRGELNAYKVGNRFRIDLRDVEAYINKAKMIKETKAESHGLINAQSLNQSLLTTETLPLSDGFIICGQDVILDILSRYLELHPKGVRALRAHLGSYNGLYALYQGKAQIATAHMWDGDTDQYNVPYVSKMLPGIPALIVNLAYRMQGFYVAKGNPKHIKNWEDFARDDITIVNREKGSGVRILIDERLRKMGLRGSEIKGYEIECSSHLAVASAVARGSADLGVGNEKTALQVKDVDFIPIQKEQYDLIMKKEDIEKPVFQAIIEIIRSDEFKAEIEGIGGYDLTRTGEIIAET
ncbi:MAG: helix-turn-helix transcriptional regulator [Thermacetogeniaceae bacterium]